MRKGLHILDLEARGANDAREPIGADATSAASFGVPDGPFRVMPASGWALVFRPGWLAAQPPVRGGYRAAPRRGRPRLMSRLQNNIRGDRTSLTRLEGCS